jgi:clan AA aspartic protease
MIRKLSNGLNLVHVVLELKNLTDSKLLHCNVTSFVNTGAMHLCIPEHIAIQLGFDCDDSDKREVTIASGEVKLCPYVGPVQILFSNRKCFTGALVLGDEVLFGAIPMKDMDLIVHPVKLSLLVNPNSPNIPSSTVK